MSFEPTDQLGGNAPIGADPVASPSNDATPASTPLELSDDTLIKDPKTGQPVKYGEYNRGFQSQFTKASQRAAQYERELNTLRQQIEQQRLAQAQPRPQAGPQEDVFAALRELPYLSGKDAVEVVQSIGQQIKQRDQVLIGTLQELKKMQQIVNGLNESSVNSSFENKMQRFVSEAGYDVSTPGMLDIAKEIYLAYTGDDLDSEFPRMFTERLKQLEGAFEAKRRAALQAARRAPFVPGKGGQANPSKPFELKGNADPREVADKMWGFWNGPET